MLVTHAALAQRARFMANHAADSTPPVWHGEIGFNYRLTNLQAARRVAAEKDQTVGPRQRVDAWYREFLGDRTDLELNPVVKSTRLNHWMICVLLPVGGLGGHGAVRPRPQRHRNRPFFRPCTPCRRLRVVAWWAIFPSPLSCRARLALPPAAT